MKHLISLLIAALCTLTAAAQQEQDFAARYMQLYAEGTSLTCSTVSPAMMQRLMNLPTVQDDSEMKALIKEIKTLRIVQHENGDEADELLQKALTLAADNPRRYQLTQEQDNRWIFSRKRGKVTLEIVLITKMRQHFYLVDVTGNMTERFTQHLLRR